MITADCVRGERLQVGRASAESRARLVLLAALGVAAPRRHSSRAIWLEVHFLLFELHRVCTVRVHANSQLFKLQVDGRVEAASGLHRRICVAR